MISPRPHQELSSSGNSHQNRFFGLVSHPLIGIMWRVLRSQRRLQHVLARASSQAQVAQAISVRSFSGKVPDVGGIPDPMAEMEMGSDAQKAPLFSASAMDFYDELAEEEVEDEHEHDDEEYRRKQEEIQKELDSRTGLVWTDPWEVSEEQWMSSTTVEDLPDWSPEYVSRISQERVKIHPDGIPTLSTIAKLPLPPPACPHPGHGQTKAYATYRKRAQYKYISEQVSELAREKVENIFQLPSWEDKQDSVDELFESVEEELKGREEILGLHPNFGKWVEKSLEEYLRSVQKDKASSSPVAAVKKAEGATEDAGEEEETSATAEPSEELDDESAHPVFMDCFSPDDPDAMVPTVLNPLKPHHNHGPGKMVEEWQLSAHKMTKRILLRQCTRAIAQTLEENAASRIYVHGRQGTGKSAILASIVASARRSGHIVLYLPDGDRLRKNGFFITPNSRREGFFDLQNLSQEACAQLMESHASDMEGMLADNDTIERYFNDTQIQRIPDYDSGAGMSLVELLKYAQERKIHAPMCYSVVVDRLMNQDKKSFLMVMDEFNCYYDRGQYFHMDYDDDVREPIPYDKINLFEPAMAAMALSTAEDDDDGVKTPALMKRGGIIVGVTESHAVPRKVTDGLTAFARRQSVKEDPPIPMHVFEVPRFSDVEADHILANFEATGIGKLRLDRGDTIMNDQEVAYLKMMSGNVGQQLLDASVV